MKRAGSENGSQASLGERGWMLSHTRGPQQAPDELPGGSAARAPGLLAGPLVPACGPHPELPPPGASCVSSVTNHALSGRLCHRVTCGWPCTGVAGPSHCGQSSRHFLPALQLRPSFEVALSPRANAPAPSLAPFPACPTRLGPRQRRGECPFHTVCWEWPHDHATPPMAPLGSPWVSVDHGPWF